MTPNPLNNIIQTLLDYTDLKPVYDTLVDLEKEFTYSHFVLDNSTDKSIWILFSNSSIPTTLRVRPFHTLAFDKFIHWGLVQIKYDTLPTIGVVDHYSW